MPASRVTGRTRYKQHTDEGCQAHHPKSGGTGEKDKGQELIEEHDDQDCAEYRLRCLGHAGTNPPVPGKKEHPEKRASEARENWDSTAAERAIRSRLRPSLGSTFSSQTSMFSWNSPERNLPVSAYSRAM